MHGAGKRLLRRESALAGDAQVEVGAGELLGEEDDLPGVEFEVRDDAEDGFEHRRRAPATAGLGVGEFQEPRLRQGGDDGASFGEG